MDPVEERDIEALLKMLEDRRVQVRLWEVLQRGINIDGKDYRLKDYRLKDYRLVAKEITEEESNGNNQAK